MTEIDDKEISIQTSSTLDVGERLRKAREARQLSIVEAASQLRLPKEVLASLEQERWERLHGRTYARGYFSSYVKFLQLDYEELLEQFNQSYKEVDRPSVVPRLKQQIKDNRGLGIPVMPILVVVTLAVVAWFVFSNQDRIIDFVSPQSGQTGGDYHNENSRVETLEPASGFSRSVEPIIDSQPATPPQNVAENLEATPQDDWLSTLLQPEAADSEISQSTETVGSTVYELQSQQSRPQLSLAFTEECWVEVIDASATTLLSRIVRAGEQVSLEGELPLNVLLGRASAVTVEFNNEPVDISGYTQGNVARFSIGADS